MSYILDALRRADSERERSAVPGLHTRPLRDGPDDEPRRRGGAPWTLLAIAALALALLAALAWILWPREAANDAAAAAPPPPVAAVAAAPVVTPPAPSPAPAAPAAQAPAPEPAPAAVTPPPAAPAPRAAPAVRPAEAPAPKKAVPDTPARKAAAAASAAAAEPRPPALKDLPDDLRRQIPALAIGGSIYSESAASRFVIINGQLFHENDTLAPELTLKQIRLKSAILEFRGQRFEIGY